MPRLSSSILPKNVTAATVMTTSTASNSITGGVNLTSPFAATTVTNATQAPGNLGDNIGKKGKIKRKKGRF